MKCMQHLVPQNISKIANNGEWSSVDANPEQWSSINKGMHNNKTKHKIFSRINIEASHTEMKHTQLTKKSVSFNRIMNMWLVRKCDTYYF